MKVVNVEQGSQDWFAMRAGRVTASRAGDIVPRKKDGSMYQAAEDYAVELVTERLTGTITQHFTTTAMQWGVDHESHAATAYEAATGLFLDRIGFVLHDSLQAGCSPDRLVGDDGLLEIKCPFNSAKVVRCWLTDDISEYIDQVNFQLWITGRAWCDLAVYDPRLTGCGKDLYVQRVHRTDEAMALIEKRVGEFLEYVKGLELKLR